MVAILGANSVSGGYEVSNSLRFNDNDSAYLSRSPSAGDRHTFTISMWVKRSNLGDTTIISSGQAADLMNINFASGGELGLYNSNGGDIQLSRKFRDVSAWYHIVIAVDTEQSTASNRVRFYVNGTEETSFNSSSYPSQNLDMMFNVNSSFPISIGKYPTSNSTFFDGYMAEVVVIDGTQLNQNSFGEFNDDGVWIPKDVSDLTFGTNGFYLEFKQTGTSANSSGMGADTSGNDNHFAVSGFTASENPVTEDTCTNNFATLNPLFRSNFDNDGTFSVGNLNRKFTSADSDRGYGFASFGVTSGKWYWEIKIPTVARANTGIGDINSLAGFSGVFYDQNPSKAFMVNYNGQIEENASATSYASSLSNNDIVMWALDMDNHRAYYGINGTWQDSGDPTSGSTGTGDVTTQISDQSHLNTGEPMFPFCFDASTSGQSQFQWNFGNPIHSISSGNNDGKYGNFEYAVPSGYYALCTKRLAEFG